MTMRAYNLFSLASALFLAFLAVCAAPAQKQHDRSPQHELLSRLQTEAVTESSGLALSQRDRDVFWTHNDSGGQARLFAFDSQGTCRAIVRIKGADAVDWEDLTAAIIDGTPCLIVADFGDNARRRSNYQLYVVKEPELANESGGEPVRGEVKLRQRVEFHYDNGSQNSEAIAWIPGSRSVLLASKNKQFRSDVYRLRLPESDPDRPLEAKRIRTLPVPLVTAMDISPDGRRLVLCTYLMAIEYKRQKGESWKDALGRDPAMIALPRRQQGESIAYGRDGSVLYLTSEGAPMPLWRTQIRKETAHTPARD